MTLPRILYAVPPLPHVHLEIAKAIQTLAAGDDEHIEPGAADPVQSQRNHELIAGIASDAWKILGKTGYNPNEPRVPAGNPDGGQWTTEGSAGPTGAPGTVFSDATPDNNWIPGAQYAANNAPGIGHNQGPPLEEPPRIPPRPPSTPQALNAFLKAAAYWLAAAGKVAAARFLGQLQALSWLASGLQYIYAFIYPPKTLAELQQDALDPQPGYNIHHVVEKKSAEDDGYPDSMINGPDNLVRIPTLKHWQITTWYQTKNPNYGGMSPRNYLRGKSWEERRRVGLDALARFGVLRP